MVAGHAAMSKWTRESVTRLNEMGTTLRARVNQVLVDAGEQAQLVGDGSLFRLMLTREPVRDYRSSIRGAQPMTRMAELHARLMREGIIISRMGLGCLSTPMGEEEIDAFVEGVRRSIHR
jgi:glutamate-1-semialdehyde 2,1-aminomutase